MRESFINVRPNIPGMFHEYYHAHANAHIDNKTDLGLLIHTLESTLPVAPFTSRLNLEIFYLNHVYLPQ